jgi:2,3-bisphosphoglycerate-independent phosphoglycerate mutase
MKGSFAEMFNLQLIQSLKRDSSSKIVLLVLDGLGGLPIEAGGPTELEAANTPNMDRLASQGAVGQTIPILPGITPGSGPAHLSLFGYDPLEFEVGRGVLEACGIGMEIGQGYVAARGNLCTVDTQGRITDRRAGRIASEKAIPIIEKLSSVQIQGVEIEVRHVKEYRFVVVLRGTGFEADIEDTDPQRLGVPPLTAHARSPGSEETAKYFNLWIDAAREILKDQPVANAFTLRGFSTDPGLPQFPDIFGLRAACIAIYPMYRGVSRLVGMQVLDPEGEKPQDEFHTALNRWDEFDFFFIHIKKPDSRGEDGDFAGKAEVIEKVDVDLPILLEKEPDVLVITGDHSTPAKMRTHSWHPIPTLLWAPATVRPDTQEVFAENACSIGGLGTFSATHLMPLMLAHAGRLEKYGA